MAHGESRPVVLALDATGSGCSAAVAVGELVLCAERVESVHGQAETLLPVVDAAMRKAGLQPSDPDLVAVTVGPGSFTGIRVGLAAAHGISLGARAQLVGVTSFEAVAAGLGQFDGSGEHFFLVALDSRREDLYVQLFDRHRNPISGPAAVMPAALGEVVDAAVGQMPLLIAGDAAQRAAVVISKRASVTVLEGSAPDALGALRALFRLLPICEQRETARPLYLRPPDVTLSSGRGKPGLGRA
jgi:tRNA threonylcarbamoyladenosine biosynthesis protein TsaB